MCIRGKIEQNKLGKRGRNMHRARKIATLLVILVSVTFAQREGGGQRFQAGSVTGQIIEATEHVPIEYANIILYSQSDSSQVTGIITNTDGYFKLSGIRPGKYYLEVHFIGFERKRIDNISIKPPEMAVELGEILLKPATINMEGVVVEGERPAISYQIDKKVISVSQLQTTISGTAVDVLENVPSVTVDIEGNVSLRGSGNFEVLIDGRPTILESSEALQQIPAATIDKIEIITNPSAKYDPEGTTGIINVVLKKGNQSGTSGILDIDAGLNNKYGINALYYRKYNGLSVTLSADYNHRYSPGDMVHRNQTTIDGNTYYIYANGSMTRQFEHIGLRGGLEYRFSPTDMVIVGMQYRTRSSQRDSDRDYEEWSTIEPIKLQYLNDNDGENSGGNYALNVSYQHDFNEKGHKLLGEGHYNWGNSNNQSVTELLNSSNQITSGQESIEKGSSNRMRIKLEYTYPITDFRKFEAGYHFNTNYSEDKNELYNYDTLAGEYIFNPDFSYSPEYVRQNQAVYAMFADKINKLGYQIGLRGEYTFREISRPDTSQVFKIDRWDIFPSLHLSYHLTSINQFMVSYSRRIHRPRGWYLEPFLTWLDAYNVRQGNPDLKPEYIDSYEVGYQTKLGRHMASMEAYYRFADNKIERLRSVYSEKIMLQSFENVGKDYALGAEFSMRFNLTQMWKLNLMGNLYQYRIEGALNSQDISRESFNWNARLNSTYNFSKSSQIQVTAMYHSPSVSAQGRAEDFFVVNFAVKRAFWDRKLTATLQVRDIFGTGKREFSSEGANFYNYTYHTREAPVIMLNLEFNFNNYKDERDRSDTFPNDTEEGEEWIY
jgi:outer membrane receptor protein involved in Fe transport